MKQTFMNSPEDILWLLNTHLKDWLPPPFKSFILYGNEDAPERLDLYASQDPNHNDPYVKVDLKEKS